MLIDRNKFLLVLLVGILSACQTNNQKPSAANTPIATNIECEPFQRDLTRPWNSKRGYCIGDDRVEYRPLVQSKAIPTPNQGLPSNNTGKHQAIKRLPTQIVQTSVADLPRGRAQDPAVVLPTSDTHIFAPSQLGDADATDTQTEFGFKPGSSLLSVDEKLRIVRIVRKMEPSNKSSVVWLQASLTETETLDTDDASTRLGINRSLAIKNILAELGYSDVRIMFPIENADKSIVSLRLKGDA